MEIEQEEESQSINSSIECDSRLGLCEVCSVNSAKYTCPRCEVKTCCLKCSNIHKKELECDGNRDKTKYVPMAKFTNLDLSSDFCLLEEIARNVEKYKKDNRQNFSKNAMLPYHLRRLQKAANDRKTVLKFLPFNFKRHSDNSTYLQFKTDVLFWHIKWVFTNAQKLTICDEKVPETMKLSSVANKYFQSDENLVLNEKLQYYQAAGICGVKFLLKAEERKKPQFYELDPSVTLKENFKKKLIIEYPVIHVVLNDHTTCYDLIDSDLDDDDDISDGNKIINKIISQSQKEENILFKEFKNLLFLNDNSDSEMSSED